MASCMSRGDHWLVKDADEEMKVWGHTGGQNGHVILKSDGEKSLVAFREALSKFHGGVVVPETSAKGESQSNGAVENAGRTVRGSTLVLKEQIEEKRESGGQKQLKRCSGCTRSEFEDLSTGF